MKQRAKISIVFLLFLVLMGSGSEAISEDFHKSMIGVGKLSLGFCVLRIRTKLSGLKGVVGIGTDQGLSIVVVVHHLSLNSKKIAETISSIGYPAKVISVEEVKAETLFSSTAIDPSGRRFEIQWIDRNIICGASSSAWKKLIKHCKEKWDKLKAK
jgi:hypothetical protein